MTNPGKRAAETKVPLLQHHVSPPRSSNISDELRSLADRTWEESKKLWQIVGPAIIGRLAMFSVNVVTQSFAGHLGDLDLAAISIANTVVVGLNFGLMLGMASALETLCGQAFGAGKHHMLGVYMQRSWIVLMSFAVALLPMYIFAGPILRLTGQHEDLATLAAKVAVWLIPTHFSFAFMFPLTRFLQCQLKNLVNAACSVAMLAVHVLLCWLVVSKLQLGLFGTAMVLNFTSWFQVICLLLYVVCGGCPMSWKGFSCEAFAGLWEFLKLSAASGVMLCLENWYYRVLVLLTGNLRNPEVAVDALSICMNVNGWELMIPLAFFAGTGVRVANELGAGNGAGAKFATVVSVATSSVIGIVFWTLILVFHDKLAYIFTSSTVLLHAVDNLSILLAFTVLLNSVQPILSGVAVGSGWQAIVAYVNVGTYYVIGVPAGIFLGWFFELGVLGIWAGMIGGTLVQTLILAGITIRCDWDKEALKASNRLEKWDTEAK